MKIVHCLFTMETGGSQILTVELLNALCMNHDVCLVIINNRYNKKLLQQLDKKVAIHYINRIEGSRSIVPVMKLNWLLMRLKPDVIHCHEPNVAKIVRVKGPALLHTIHDIGLPVFNYPLYHSLVAISDSVHKDVIAACDHPVSVVYNGIPLQSFNKRTDHTLSKENAIRMVQISRLVHAKKGQDVLIRALHTVINVHKHQEISLDLIGSGASEKYLRKLVSELGLEKQVRFIGEKERDWLFAHLSHYHLLVQPSRYEGFGLTVLEGMAAGLPVLVSNIDGPAEIISRTPAGFLFENEDVAGCAQQLMNIINLYLRNGIADLVTQSVPVIEKYYSLQSCVNGYLKEYSRLTCRRRALVALAGNGASF